MPLVVRPGDPWSVLGYVYSMQCNSFTSVSLLSRMLLDFACILPMFDYQLCFILLFEIACLHVYDPPDIANGIFILSGLSGWIVHVF